MSKPEEYDRIFIEALGETVGDYQTGKIRLFSERDLLGHLFFHCRLLMEKRRFPIPLKIFAERGVLDKRKKVDLVLGDDEILVELKCEPDYPGVSKPVVLRRKQKRQELEASKTTWIKYNNMPRREK